MIEIGIDTNQSMPREIIVERIEDDQSFGNWRFHAIILRRKMRRVVASFRSFLDNIQDIFFNKTSIKTSIKKSLNLNSIVENSRVCLI